MHFINIAYASSEAVEKTAETAAAEGVLGSLGINPSLLIFQLINFAIVATILWFLILKPLLKKMDERQKMIDDSIDNARKVQESVVRAERDYQTKIDTAKIEANKIIEKAGGEAEKLSVELKNKTKQEIEHLVEQTKRHIKAEKEAMSEELKIQTATLVTAALEKILKEKITAEKDIKIIEEALKNLK